MKYAVLVFMFISLVGCASLPKPTESGLAQFVVPVYTINESSQQKFGYSYVLRIINQDTREQTSVTVIPKRGLSLIVKKNLTPGKYCFVGYRNVPIKEKGYRYTYESELHEYNDCFTLVENRLTVWDNKVAILKRNGEKLKQSWTSHNFIPLQSADKEMITAELQKFGNFDLWSPVKWENN